MCRARCRCQVVAYNCKTLCMPLSRACSPLNSTRRLFCLLSFLPILRYYPSCWVIIRVSDVLLRMQTANMGYLPDHTSYCSVPCAPLAFMIGSQNQEGNWARTVSAYENKQNRQNRHGAIGGRNTESQCKLLYCDILCAVSICCTVSMIIAGTGCKNRL